MIKGIAVNDVERSDNTGRRIHIMQANSTSSVGAREN
jgi:hypothetical protein